MRTGRRTILWLGVLALGWLTGCLGTGPRFDPRPKVSAEGATNLTMVAVTNKLEPEWLQTPSELFTLGPGDVVEIELLGEPGSRAMTVVGPDGKVYFHLLPGLDVWGLTLAQTKALLERELLKFVRAEPQVAVNLRGVGSKRVWLLGRLNLPGVYMLATPMTLLEGISLAGSTPSTGASAEEVADLRRSFVIRQGQLLSVDFHRLLREGDMSQNIYLRPDDFVYLRSAVAREVYVLGAVFLPNIVPFRERLTLVGAVASAGGTIKDAYLSHVAIVRGSLTEPHIALVDYKAILKGEAPDVALEPQDIVYVPFTPYRVLTRYLNMILSSFVNTVAINEGQRAVFRNANPVQVNVPGISISPR